MTGPARPSSTAKERWFRRHPRLAVLAVVVLLTLVVDVASANVLRLAGIALFDPPDKLFRTVHPLYHHDLRPNVACVARWGPIEYPMRTNSLGFRDREVRTIDVAAGDRRILLIGDSFTEGIGVSFADTFAGILQQHLGARGIEVLDAAAVSYAPIIYLRKIRHLVNDVGLRFARLIVCVDLSDVQDEALAYHVTTAGTLIAARHNRVSELLKSLVDEHTVVLKGLRRVLGHWRRAGAIGAGADWHAALGRSRALWTVDDALFAAWGREGLARASRHMTELRELLRVHGIAMTVVVYPWPDQIDRDDLDSRQVRHWAAWAAAHDADFVDCFPAFFAPGEPAPARIRRFFIPGDVHFNAAGHRAVADSILGSLR